MEIVLSERWTQHYPRAGAGILILTGIQNSASGLALKEKQRELEADLRGRFAAGGKSAIRGLPVMQAYTAYYKAFGKTYHVQMQTESVALNNRPLPSVSALVDVMFMAELSSGLLTAGHDLPTLQGPVIIDVAEGVESYTALGGKEQMLKAGDMYMRDAAGVISSVLYGPDARTPISLQTNAAMFAVYAPEGISRAAVEEHLQAIQAGVTSFAPAAQTALLQTFGSRQSFL